MVARTHVLFDLDGTLLDTEPGIACSLRWACRREGLPLPTDAQVRSLIGPPIEVGLTGIGVPEHLIGPVADAYNDHYRRVGVLDSSLFPGIGTLLNSLTDRGLTLAVATAKPEPAAQRALDHLGISERFAACVGVQTEAGRRTKSEVIGAALTTLGLRQSPALTGRVVMVGDRDHDVIGAADHQLRCIGVTWGYGSAQELLSAGAAALAHEPADLVDQVLQARLGPAADR
ncbi:MAG: HAD hydrolase-like protein [Propioniciclava sp.]